MLKVESLCLYTVTWSWKWFAALVLPYLNVLSDRHPLLVLCALPSSGAKCSGCLHFRNGFSWRLLLLAVWVRMVQSVVCVCVCVSTLNLYFKSFFQVLIDSAFHDAWINCRYKDNPYCSYGSRKPFQPRYHIGSEKGWVCSYTQGSATVLSLFSIKCKQASANDLIHVSWVIA